MTQFTFHPSIQKLDFVQALATSSELDEEPMIYSGSLDFAYEHGGHLTRKVIDGLRTEVESHIQEMDKIGYTPVIDTKILMLMPGQYPCIGGWHCDGVIRDNYDSQPDLNKLNTKILNYTCLIPSVKNISNTEFVNQPITTSFNKENVWNSISVNINEIKDLNVLKAEDGFIYRFNQATLHRGTAATKRGWRFFFRLSFFHTKPLNKIRRQVQVYTVPDNSY